MSVVQFRPWAPSNPLRHKAFSPPEISDGSERYEYIGRTEVGTACSLEVPVIALLDNGQDLGVCSAEIDGPVGQLLTPLTRYRLRSDIFAIDNGGFNNLDPAGLLSLMKREEHHREKCLFVTCPDIVGSAQRTLEVFKVWRPKLDGWKVALACQDGQEYLPIPWDEIDAIFIGGSTSWKCSVHVEQIVKTALLFDKHVHAGRVNDPTRFAHFERMGVHSCDGSGLARYTHMRTAVANRAQQKDMLDDAA